MVDWGGFISGMTVALMAEFLFTGMACQAGFHGGFFRDPAGRNIPVADLSTSQQSMLSLGLQMRIFPAGQWPMTFV
jgi:hypothetical protein